MRKFIAIVILLSSLAANAQELTVSADLVSRYVWRGQLLGKTAHIQPTLDYTYKGFSIGSWGSYSIVDMNENETDLYLSYAKSNFSFTLYDYWVPNLQSPKGDYLVWNHYETTHTLEGIVTWDGTENFPMQITAGTFFYGYDQDSTGKQLYSTYFEINYAFNIAENELKPFVGFTPATGYYSDNGLQLVNVGISGSRTIKINENYEIPVGLSLITNPHKEMVFLVFSLTF